MLIRLGYDIHFDIPAPVPMVALLSVHPSRRHDLREPDRLRVEPEVATDEHEDIFGNISTRFVAPAGTIRLVNSTIIEDSGSPDPVSPDAREVQRDQDLREIGEGVASGRLVGDDIQAGPG